MSFMENWGNVLTFPSDYDPISEIQEEVLSCRFSVF